MTQLVPPPREHHVARTPARTRVDVRTSASTEHDDEHLGGATRELIVLAVVLVVASRFLEGPLVWVVMALVALAVALGSLQLMGDAHPVGQAMGIPVESLVLPTVTAIAGVGVVRLVPIGLLLVPFALLLAYAIQRAISIEMRVILAPHGATAADRTAVLVQSVVLAFVAFAGIAALVPGGLPDLTVTATGTGSGAGAVPDPGAVALSTAGLATIVAGDAVIAGLLGFRAAALRLPQFRDVIWSALTYAAIIGISAAAIRAMEIPRLLGPGLLTVVLYLWDAIHGAPVGQRRDARRVWEAVLLTLLAVIVVVWTLAVRV